MYHFEDDLTQEDRELFDRFKSEQTVSGRLDAIESACASVLEAADLPTGPAWYERGFANVPWPVASHRGFAPDSREGFAAQMMGDVYFVRKARNDNDYEQAAILMFFLGVKWSASGIKERHSSKSRPLQPSRKQQRNVAMAREFQRRRAKSRLSDSALMTAIGREQTRPLTRSSAIEAIRRGLQFLSG